VIKALDANPLPLLASHRQHVTHVCAAADSTTVADSTAYSHKYRIDEFARYSPYTVCGGTGPTTSPCCTW
jgi:hypothetical protein